MQRFVLVLLVGFLSLFLASCEETQSQNGSSVCEDPAPSGPASTDIVWTCVGSAGNAADPPVLSGAKPLGAVAYDFEISKYETTNAQYAEFLNVMAMSGTRALWIPSNPTPAILRNGTDGSYTYDVVPGLENRPVQKVNYLQALRFTNWLENGKPTAEQAYTPVVSECPNFFRTKWQDAGMAGCRRLTGGYSGIIPTGGSGTGMVLSMSFVTNGTSPVPSFRPLVGVRVDDTGVGYQAGDVLTIAEGAICDQGFPVSINSGASITLEASDFRDAEDTTTENGAAPLCLSFVKDRFQADSGDRNNSTTYFLPNVNEWYKAAYYDGNSSSYYDFPASSDTETACACSDVSDAERADANSANCDGIVGATVDVGSYRNSLSPNGTLDQGGNLFEWIDTDGPYIECPTRVVRGSSFNLAQRPNISYMENSSYYNECVSKALDTNGFRVARYATCP